MLVNKFILKSPFEPVEEQRKAIDVLTRGLNE
jgi:excinuclease UvrABC helicase subunit UvrB